jgi:hypothetical protein
MASSLLNYFSKDDNVKNNGNWHINTYIVKYYEIIIPLTYTSKNTMKYVILSLFKIRKIKR